MANQSGLSDLPTLLPYPALIPLDVCNAIHGVFCYSFDHYGDIGFSVLLSKKDDAIRLLVGDWKGNVVDLHNQDAKTIVAKKLLTTQGEAIIELCRAARISQAQFFFVLSGDNFVLVDVQLSLNKFAGPGMVRDVFGNVFKTQEVIGIDVLDDDIMDSIVTGTNKFSGSLILKPSRFRSASVDGSLIPLYVEVIR